jgi:hypothetical protein
MLLVDKIALDEFLKIGRGSRLPFYSINQKKTIDNIKKGFLKFMVLII